jgi:hypothetical protein
MSKSIQQQPNHDDIARSAYHLWEQSGKPAGREVEFWLAAEALLRSPARRVQSRRPARSAPRSAPAAPSARAPVSKEVKASAGFGTVGESPKR